MTISFTTEAGEEFAEIDLDWVDYERLARSALAEFKTFDEYINEVLRRQLEVVVAEDD